MRMGAKNQKFVNIQHRSHTVIAKGANKEHGKVSSIPRIQQRQADGQVNARADQVAMTPAVKIEAPLTMFAVS